MLLASYYLIIALILSIVVAVGVILKRINIKSYNIFLKVLSLVVAAVFAVRYMWGEDAIRNTFMLQLSPFGEDTTSAAFGLLAVWFSYASAIFMSLYGFFKSELSGKLVKFLVLPVSIFVAVCLKQNIIAINGADALAGYGTRQILMVVETGLVLAYAIFVLINETNWKNLFAKKELKEKLTASQIFKKVWFVVFCGLVFFIATMPSYELQGLFGFIKQSSKMVDFELAHRMCLYIGIILPIIIHVTLKDKDYATKKLFILFICLGTLTSFSLGFKGPDFLDPTNWPLHLCNTAMYIMPFVLIFNLKKFFYFTYFINVAGAFLAMLMPNYSESLNMFATRAISFYTNHYIACWMPILFVSLGLFKKPKLKEFIYSMIGFAAYFALVLFINALYSGMFELGMVTQTTDYFFVNSDFIAEKLGQWAENLRLYTAVVTIKGIPLTFYWLYQILFFVTYVGIGLVVWFIYAYIYQLHDFYVVLGEKKQKIKMDQLALCAKYGKKEIDDCMSEASVNKLLVTNASKRYGESDVYSLKEASFEVKGGEILGFLGPNGAGKSTLIKSVVGMQPLTSGSIEINGYDIEKQPVLAKSQLGFVPDHYALYEKLTGREYVNYIADLYGVEKKVRDKRLQELIDQLEMNASIDSQMRTYSHGMKQKIAIMSALIHNPKLWILDEPLTGLDPNSIHQVKECMKEHAKKGNIVFFSSHIIDIVEKLCDRIIIIKKGQILTQVKLADLKKNGVDLEDFYLETIKDKKVDLELKESSAPSKAKTKAKVKG